MALFNKAIKKHVERKEGINLNNISLLHSALNASSLRQQTISNNIANAETPGYKAKKVVFEDILKQHLTDQSSFVGTRTNARHLTIGNVAGNPMSMMVENTDHHE